LEKTADYSAFLKPSGEGRVNLDLAIEGISSADAIAEIERALSIIPGLTHARLNFTTRRLSTEWIKSSFNPSPAILTLENLGYRVAPFSSDDQESEEDRYTRWLLRCLVVSGFAGINVMLLSVSIWAGNVTDITPETRDLFHWLSALIALPAAAFSGQPFFYKALRALRQGDMTMDVPISIGITLALGMSVYETAHHAEHAYFDSALMLIFFLLSGRVLDHAMRKKTRSAAANLAALRIPTASRLDIDGRISEVPSDALITGDKILVAPGSRVPADGVIEFGTSQIESSLVTGETEPKSVTPGDLVFAGTLNQNGALTVRVSASGSRTVLADIENLIDEALTKRSRYVQIADRVARLYAPIVHMAAALTAMAWIAIGATVHDALVIAIAVLIITCPCALALAAPVVQVITAGALFRKNILIRSADMIERMAETDTIIFDKTGTLTLPEPSLIDASSLTPAELMMAGRLAVSSHHPLARAICEAVRETGSILTPYPETQEITGSGVSCLIDGVEARLGHPTFCNVPAPIWTDNRSYIGFRYGENSGLIFVGQKLRADAAQIINALKARRYRVLILSGDHDRIVKDVANHLKIAEWHSAMSPKDKRDFLTHLKDKGHHVLMIGDGLNDAPALAAATASLSPATGADVTQAAADAVFTGKTLAPVLDLLLLTQKGRRVMVENFGLALIYNLIAVPLAVFGYVTPLIAAAAMSGSSMIVALNALRARRADGMSS
jgi:Cu2+-exporting ATPase